MDQNFTTDVTQWQGVDVTPESNSHNLVESGGVHNNISQLSQNIQSEIDRGNLLFNSMVGNNGKMIPLVWKAIQSNKYWNLANNKAALIVTSGYYANIELIEVQPGDIIYMRVKKTVYPNSNFAAYSAYDAEKIPYNGSVARFDFTDADSAIDNNDGTVTYIFIIPENCYYVGLNYKDEPYQIYYSKQNQEYEYSDNFKNAIAQFGVNHAAFNKMVGTIIETRSEIIFQNTQTNKYWNLSGGVAALVSVSSYYANGELVAVNAGEKLEVTVKNNIITALDVAAYSAYDNDGHPYNGRTARIDFSAYKSAVDNGNGTTTYTFVIPSGCTQVGLYYKTETAVFYRIYNQYIYSQTLDDHIENVAGGGSTTASDSAKYFLKGEAPKSFAKKSLLLLLVSLI